MIHLITVCIEIALTFELNRLSRQLLILRKITDRAGRVFRPLKGEYILVEGLFSSPDFTRHFPIDFTSFLPVHDCLSPRETLNIYKGNEKSKGNQVLLEVCLF